MPLFLDMTGQSCLVVGGGKIAARKLGMLIKAGAKITVVAPSLCAQAKQIIADHSLNYVERNFANEDLSGIRLVIAATDDRDTNKCVVALAKKQNIWVNAADHAEQGNAILPSVIDRDPIQIAISTGASSPVLARMMRSRLEHCTPAQYGALAALVEGYREQVKSFFPGVRQRRLFWENILEGPVAELVFAGQNQQARQLLERRLREDPEVQINGEVYLVGAGPGDPDLLTFRALRLMQQADVVVYDRLVSDQIMNLLRKDAEKIYAGKEKALHTLPQESINQLLVRLAKQGKRVLRLKGGDPFIFGRGGEEIETLIDERIPFQVVPGITAAAGCAAYSGIPLTHRDYAQACIFVTGHLRDGTVNLNWDMLAHQHQTIVFYMGLSGLSVICEQLRRHGMRDDMPAALITQGTTPQQRVFIGDLTTLPSLVDRHAVKAPTLIIVGEVVLLHNKLHWFRSSAEIEA